MWPNLLALTGYLTQDPVQVEAVCERNLPAVSMLTR